MVKLQVLKTVTPDLMDRDTIRRAGILAYGKCSELVVGLGALIVGTLATSIGASEANRFLLATFDATDPEMMC